MKPLSTLAILLLAAACSAAQAGVKGQCVFQGKTLAFVDAHAALGPDPFEDTKKVPMLWLATAALDHAALANAKPDEVDDAVSEQVFELNGAKLALRFDAGGKVVEGLQLYVPPGTSRSISGNDVGELKLVTPMTTRANGHFKLSDDDELKCDIQFDVAIGGMGPPPPAPKPWGTALPAGGGEPGKVYLALHRASLAGDVDAMLGLATKDRADKMREARGEPDFPKMIEMIKAFEPAQVSVISGRADANRAELQINGKDSDGATVTGVVKLIREAGAWRVEKVSTKSKL
ncbi:MAG: hypothetical protein WC213_04520 [Arenimonas sp.]